MRVSRLAAVVDGSVVFPAGTPFVENEWGAVVYFGRTVASFKHGHVFARTWGDGKVVVMITPTREQVLHRHKSCSETALRDDLADMVMMDRVLGGSPGTGRSIVDLKYALSRFGFRRSPVRRYSRRTTVARSRRSRRARSGARGSPSGSSGGDDGPQPDVDHHLLVGVS